MKINNPHQRLKSLWGDIDRQHNELIYKGVKGPKILDVGCGYGSLIHFLSQKGLDAIGVDCDRCATAIAKKIFPDVNILNESVEGDLQGISTGSLDTVILKDSLHHIYFEADYKKVFANFRAWLKPSGTLVVADPNPVWFWRLARKIIGHRDFELPCQRAVKVLQDEQFHVHTIVFYETIGLALSGGYVGPRLVPNIMFLNKIVSTTNDTLSKLCETFHVGRHLCVRYFIYAKKAM